MASIDVRHLGNYIREQRGASDISLRQLAKLAGVSNPYLSQIERGLRKPSAEILQQIAKGLRISAEAMYVQAGILDERVGDGLLSDAVHADDGLTERQKQVLLEIYESFRKENAVAEAASGSVAAAAVSLVSTSTGLENELSSASARAKPSPASKLAPTSTSTSEPASAAKVTKPATKRATGKSAASKPTAVKPTNSPSVPSTSPKRP